MKKGGKVSSKNCLTVIDLFGNDTKTKLDEENRLLSSILIYVRHVTGRQTPVRN